MSALAKLSVMSADPPPPAPPRAAPAGIIGASWPRTTKDGMAGCGVRDAMTATARPGSMLPSDVGAVAFALAWDTGMAASPGGPIRLSQAPIARTSTAAPISLPNLTQPIGVERIPKVPPPPAEPIGDNQNPYDGGHSPAG